MMFVERMGSFDENLFPKIADVVRKLRLRYVEGRDE